MATPDHPPIRAKIDALAIVAFICGLASFGVIPIVGGVLAIVLGCSAGGGWMLARS